MVSHAPGGAVNTPSPCGVLRAKLCPFAWHGHAPVGHRKRQPMQMRRNGDHGSGQWNGAVYMRSPKSRKENLVKQPSALAPYTAPVRHRSSGGNGSVQSPTLAVTEELLLRGKGETLAVQLAAKKASCVCCCCAPLFVHGLPCSSPRDTAKISVSATAAVPTQITAFGQC